MNIEPYEGIGSLLIGTNIIEGNSSKGGGGEKNSNEGGGGKQGGGGGEKTNSEGGGGKQDDNKQEKTRSQGDGKQEKTSNQSDEKGFTTKYMILSGLLLIWVISGFIAFIYSLVCFGSSSDITEKVIGVLLAIFFGPIYFIYLYYNSGYCVKDKKNSNNNNSNNRRSYNNNNNRRNNKN